MGCSSAVTFGAWAFCHYCRQLLLPDRIRCGSVCRRSVTSYRRLVIAFSFHDAKTGECSSGRDPDAFSRAYIGRARSQRLPLKVNDLTSLILTSNEEANIRRTLEALRWLTRVVIIAGQSTDGTVEIARTFSNVQIYQRQFDTFAEQCNFGLTHMTTEWVLSLDADYVLPPELQEELKRLQPPQDVRGYSIAFDYCVFGRPLRNSIL